VHLDLQAAGVLPDLYSGYEDWGQAWVGESAWTYRRKFDAPGCAETGGTGCGATLEFDGVDTLATVSLNGDPVLECDNQFRRYSVRVDGLLRGQDSNELEVSIRSPFLEAEAL
jgi:beta-mannosidase